MRGGIRRAVSMLAGNRVPPSKTPLEAMRERFERRNALDWIKNQYERAMRAARNAYRRRHGASKYKPHVGAKEVAKWKRRMANGWHQPRGTGDQYVYRDFKTAMAAIS